MTNILSYTILNTIYKRNLHLLRKCSTAQLPKRVKRDNLTILKELASTVKTDYGGTRYQFIDDPYLIPISGIDKKVAMLSTQSGRNAARYVMDRYPNLFVHDTSFPVVKDFCPPVQRTVRADAVEELAALVSLLKPLEAYAAYKRALDDGVDIERPLVDDLLDLLCFSNGDNLPSPLPAETRFYMDGLELEEAEAGKEAPVWREEGPAESIFKSLEDPSSRNISAIIKGRTKFKAYELAFSEYMKIMESKKKIEVGVHNAVLSMTHHLREESNDVWRLILDIFELMQESAVKPTVDTFNSALSAMAHQAVPNPDYIPLENVHKKFNQALTLMGELVSCKLTPNLTTWWHLLEISYPNYRTRGTIIHNIIEYVASNDIHLHRDTDFAFFDSAMSKCMRNVRSMEAARKLQGLVEAHCCESMLGSSGKSSSYFTSYLVTLMQHDNIANIMAEYNRLVPNMYVPTYKVINYLLKAIEQHYAYDHIPKLWKDMLAFRYHRRRDLLAQLMSVMSKAPKDEKLQAEYTEIVDALFKLFLLDASMPHISKPLELSGQLVSEMLLVYINADHFEKAWNLFKKFLEITKTGSGLIKEEPLISLCQHCIQNNHLDQTLEVLKVMSEYGYACVEDLVQQACNNTNISDHQKIQLKNLLWE